MPPELHPAVLQSFITLGLAATAALLARTYRKSVFVWWTAAWWLYFARLVIIMAFVLTGTGAFLFWHQVFTGWSALALLGTALAFSGSYRFRPWHVALAAVPFAWAWIAINRLEQVELAAIPAVLFLSGATMITAWIFGRFAHRASSAGAGFLAVAYALWSLHHLDYPILRARGVWMPWGYYLDIGFELAVGAGMLLLVMEDLRRGVQAFATVSRELATSALRQRAELLDTLLARLLTLPAVRGAALYERGSDGMLMWSRGAGVCTSWDGQPLSPADASALERSLTAGRSIITPAWEGPDQVAKPYTFAAVLPVRAGTMPGSALVIVGDERDPFAALDERFLTALGEQIGAALEAAEMAQGLAQRTRELERLSGAMVRQHEEARRRFARELHDESAQVLAAVKMELGVLHERLAPDDAVRLEDAIALLDSGIRAVARDLRPALLDDLGLIPALRSLADDFQDHSGLVVHTDICDPSHAAPITPDAELAVFRALQEGLANVARHADAASVWVTLQCTGPTLSLEVRDDGRGVGARGLGGAEDDGTSHAGLSGMRERVGALGGTVGITSAPIGGTTLTITLPLP